MTSQELRAELERYNSRDINAILSATGAESLAEKEFDWERELKKPNSLAVSALAAYVAHAAQLQEILTQNAKTSEFERILPAVKTDVQQNLANFREEAKLEISEKQGVRNIQQELDQLFRSYDNVQAQIKNTEVKLAEVVKEHATNLEEMVSVQKEIESIEQIIAPTNHLATIKALGSVDRYAHDGVLPPKDSPLLSNGKDKSQDRVLSPEKILRIVRNIPKAKAELVKLEDKKETLKSAAESLVQKFQEYHENHRRLNDILLATIGEISLVSNKFPGVYRIRIEKIVDKESPRITLSTLLQQSDQRIDRPAAGIGFSN